MLPPIELTLCVQSIFDTLRQQATTRLPVVASSSCMKHGRAGCGLSKATFVIDGIYLLGVSQVISFPSFSLHKINIARYVYSADGMLINHRVMHDRTIEPALVAIVFDQPRREALK